MSLLFLIPKNVSVDVLSQWCELQDVMKVDSAFCNQTDRPYFLQLFKCKTFSVHCVDSIAGIKFVVRHKIFTRSILLDERPNTLKFDIQFFTYLYVSKINHLSLGPSMNYNDCWQNKHLTKFISSCSVLASLNIAHQTDESQFILINVNPKVLNQLTSFHYTGRNLSKALWMFLGQHLRSLIHLHITQSKNGDGDIRLCPSVANYILVHNPSIQSLSLGTSADCHCAICTLPNVDSIAELCPQLTKVHLQFNFTETSLLGAVHTLVTSCLALTDLKIENANQTATFLSKCDQTRGT